MSLYLELSGDGAQKVKALLGELCKPPIATKIDRADKPVLEKALATWETNKDDGRSTLVLSIGAVKVLKKYSTSKLWPTDCDRSVARLTKGSRLSFPPRPTSTPEIDKDALQKRRRYLELLQAEKEYKRMTANITGRQRRAQEKREFRTFIQQGSIGLNMIIARITGLIFCYYVSRNLFTEESHRWLFALAGGIGIMVVELILFIIREYRRDVLGAKEQKVTEDRIKSHVMD